MSDFTLFLLGAGGALAGEVASAHALRFRLHHAEYDAIKCSVSFWVASLAMIAIAGFLAFVMHADSESPVKFNVVLTGLGASTIIRSSLTSINAATSKTNLGPNQKHIWRSIFR